MAMSDDIHLQRTVVFISDENSIREIRSQVVPARHPNSIVGDSFFHYVRRFANYLDRIQEIINQGLTLANNPNDNSNIAGGLTKEIIDRKLNKRVHTHDQNKVGEKCDDFCAVCLNILYQENEKIATLDCGHEFHVGCITEWLMRKNLCPMCRATALYIL
ncbi:hypothetical protein ACJIZ3_007341 [Penstemon smallii]|uniref:RING-type E3 ubiquitin transferase n=1 Tax=Penstemon smallii TaxID=265156 RepID=A0ABD3SA91_9LAMI